MRASDPMKTTGLVQVGGKPEKPPRGFPHCPVMATGEHKVRGLVFFGLSREVRNLVHCTKPCLRISGHTQLGYSQFVTSAPGR